MMRYFVFGLILIVFNTAVEGQSKIKKAEESLISSEKSSLSSTLEYSASETHKTSESGGFFTDFVGDVFVQIFAYTVYAAAFESPFEMENKASRAFLTTAPYYQSKKDITRILLIRIHPFLDRYFRVDIFLKIAD